MYAMVGTRPDLAQAVSIVSKYLESPKKIHCGLVKHLFKYLRSSNYSLYYIPQNGDVKLKAYGDAAYANQDGTKSTSGYLMKINNCPVSWNSQRQSLVALSTAESELIAAVSACKISDLVQATSQGSILRRRKRSISRK